MNTEKMSVSRALSELKLTDSRISKELSGNVFVAVKIGNKINNSNKTEKELVKQGKAGLDSVKDLIARRDAIKRAIVASNATTEVKIGDKTYTVAGAIEMKSSLAYKKLLMNTLRSQLAQANATAERENASVKARLDKQLETMLGKEQDKVDRSTVESLSAAYKEANGATVIDTVNAEDLVRELEKEIDTFESNVDIVLSESNALTQIEVSY